MEAVLTQDKPYLFRPYLHDDIPFIQSAWGTSYYNEGYGNTLLSLKEFHGRHRPIREAILSKPNIAVIVCCSKEDKDTLLGFSIIEKPEESPLIILHYIYVKSDFRDKGLGKELLFKAIKLRPVLYTHLTMGASKILRRRSSDLDRFIYTPHII